MNMGGCGKLTYVIGTNGGTMLCGTLYRRFGVELPYYCDHCAAEAAERVRRALEKNRLS